MTPGLSDRTHLRLYDLFSGAFAHFYYTLVVPLTGFRNTQDMLARRNVGEYDAA